MLNQIRSIIFALSLTIVHNSSAATVTTVPAAEASCAICLSPLGKLLLVLEPCTHAFDRACIIHWLKTKNTCPICRTPTTNSPITPATPSIGASREMSSDDDYYSSFSSDDELDELFDSFSLNNRRGRKEYCKKIIRQRRNKQ